MIKLAVQRTMNTSFKFSTLFILIIILASCNDVSETITDSFPGFILLQIFHNLLMHFLQIQ